MALLLCPLVLLAGCAKGDDNSPDMGAVAPKPNPGVARNAPGAKP